MSVACASIFRVAAPSTPISWSAATVSAPAFVRNWRRCAADLCRLLHLARGAQRIRPRRRDAAHDLSAVYLLSAKAAAVDHLPDRRFDDDLTPGKRRFNFIWYRVADAAR